METKASDRLYDRGGHGAAGRTTLGSDKRPASSAHRRTSINEQGGHPVRRFVLETRVFEALLAPLRCPLLPL